MHAGCRKAVAFGLAAMLMAGVSSAVAQSGSGDVLEVRLPDDATIRDVAELYLGDPDLWEEILKASGVSSVAELKPGQVLRVPRSEIVSANEALIESLERIQAANSAGAQVFAFDEITLAIDLRDTALEEREARNWPSTYSFATQSIVHADDAHDKSLAQRDQSVEALLTDRSGAVEGRRPQELGWSDRYLRNTLVEQERVRTLSGSTAQITFRDASRLRLNNNSNAVIRRMRVDPLSGRQEARVTLVEGDFYALLADENERRQFSVDIPEVDAEIESGNFWVSHDRDSAKFTNYDSDEVRVAAQGQSLTLNENEGTVVRKGEAPDLKVDVLAPPDLARPGDDARIYSGDVELGWNPLEDAVGYWLELARDQQFNAMVTSEFGLEDPTHLARDLEPGSYFWRVSALDGFGLPGQRSPVQRFAYVEDVDPPFLSVVDPRDGVVSRIPQISLNGEAEPGASVSVVLGEGASPMALDVDAAGAFTGDLVLMPGENLIVVTATDTAGNARAVETTAIHVPDVEIPLVFDEALPRLAPRHFLSGGEVLTLGGLTAPAAAVRVLDAEAQVLAAGSADTEGAFRLSIPLDSAEQTALTLIVETATGQSLAAEFKASIDDRPPALALDSPPPRLVGEPYLDLSGSTDPNASLTVNGEPLAVAADGSFTLSVDLLPGANELQLTATNQLGAASDAAWRVTYDNSPPVLLSQSASRLGEGASALAIEVVAEDDTGLAAVASATVAAEGETFTGFLRLNRANNTYAGEIQVPAALLGRAQLVEVELADHAGNVAVERLK